jgi:hypothetical protein
VGAGFVDPVPAPNTCLEGRIHTTGVNMHGNSSSRLNSISDPQNISDAIKILFEPEQVVELRVPKAGKFGTISGYFNDHEKLAKELAELSGTVPAVYYTLNPVAPSLRARANNRIECYAKHATSDLPDNIIKRRWLFVDCDPVRPAGISSTDEEKQAAKRLVNEVNPYLKSVGWPEPVMADSGNGYHLLYRIDLPNDDSTRRLLESVLKALAARFDNEVVKVDQKVFNSGRITKAYGTMACKGDSIRERPHRLSKMFKPPESIEIVSRDLLEALAAEAPRSEKKKTAEGSKSTTSGGWTPQLVESVLDKAELNRGEATDYKGAQRWQHDCLSDSSHKRPDAYTILNEDGYAHHHCAHNSCIDLKDEDWRSLWEEKTGESYPWPNRRKRERSAVEVENESSGEEDCPASVSSWSEIANQLDAVRCGTETITDGEGNAKKVNLPKHVAEERILQFVKDVFENRGKGQFFFDAYPYIYLPDEKQVVRFHDDSEANSLLGKMRLRIKQIDTALVKENLRSYITENGEPTRVEKIGCLRGNSIYVNNGRGGVFKITPENISEVPNGTDGVLMFAPDVQPFPELDEIKLAAIRQKLNGIGGKLLDTRLCYHMDAHFDESGNLTQVQYQQLVLLRFLSLFLGSYLDLRPIMMALGEQNSGKSTLWEKFMWLICGIHYESAAMPPKMRDFVAAMTNNPINIFDNIDSVNFENSRSDYQYYIDLMCKAATGGTIPIAELYKTNVQKKYSLRCDQFFTARVNPFPSHRSDLGRRTLFFPIRTPLPEEYKTTEQIKRELAEDFDEMKLELLVRLQNILVALTENAKDYHPVTQMHSFETLTMRIADHEGWGEDMRSIWQGYMGEYQNRMTEDSPFVEYLRRWIGMSTTNCGREARAGEIYGELQGAFGLSFSKMWRSSAAFGKKLKENITALRILGVKTRVLHGNPRYKFEPDSEQLERCRDAWNDSAPARLRGDEQLGVVSVGIFDN